MAPWRRQSSRRHYLGMWRSGYIGLEVRGALLQCEKHDIKGPGSFTLRMHLLSQCIHLRPDAPLHALSRQWRQLSIETAQEDADEAQGVLGGKRSAWDTATSSKSLEEREVLPHKS